MKTIVLPLLSRASQLRCIPRFVTEVRALCVVGTQVAGLVAVYLNVPPAFAKLYVLFRIRAASSPHASSVVGQLGVAFG